MSTGEKIKVPGRNQRTNTIILHYLTLNIKLRRRHISWPVTTAS